MSTVLITGTNRGIGFELARQYGAAGWQVLACCRDPSSADALNELSQKLEVRVHELDVANFRAIDRLAETLRDEPIDVLINNAGMFGPKPGAENDFRQSFGHMDYDVWANVIKVNMMAPMKMAEAFVEQIARSAQKKLITISSTVGSISETEGGLHAYRTSKAGVNMVMASLARELKPRGIAVRILCPGWVQTAMGGAGAPIKPQQSVTGIRKQIAELTLEASGEFRRYNGEPIAW